MKLLKSKKIRRREKHIEFVGAQRIEVMGGRGKRRKEKKNELKTGNKSSKS